MPQPTSYVNWVGVESDGAIVAAALDGAGHLRFWSRNTGLPSVEIRMWGTLNACRIILIYYGTGGIGARWILAASVGIEEAWRERGLPRVCIAFFIPRVAVHPPSPGDGPTFGFEFSPPHHYCHHPG
ncbi:hypothetical protein BD779DRAFT_1476673 [Infundibulicybe gibba]|nr:hypothetical protein BD779DRAFT_1476673 [Infundibulicybe gibba]